jgi:hypothetical protein
MAFIYMFSMIGVGQAGVQTQQIAPPSGGVSPLAWVIICALAGTVVAGAGRLLTLLASTSYERPDGLGCSGTTDFP